MSKEKEAAKLEQIKKEAMANVEAVAKEKATEVASEVMKEITEKMEGLSSKEDVEKALEKAMADLDKKHQKFISEQKKKASIHESEEEAIDIRKHLSNVLIENAERLKGYLGGSISLTTKASPATIVPSSFTGIANFTQRPQEGVIMTPANRVWISDYLVSATSDGSSVIYPKEDTTVGAMDLHTAGSSKAKLQYKLTTANAMFKTVAGYVIVDRAMLDDVSFLNSYLQNRLYNDLRNKENAIILAGTSDSSPLEGIYEDATSYDGKFTDPVGKILDALYGQIAGETSDNYIGNTLFLHPRDIPTIGLQIADGSGEYNLPAGMVSYVNGKLNIGGAQVVATSHIEEGKFLAIDNSAVAFVRRMLPELKVSDEGLSLMKENEVMFRIEERFTQLIFNKDALVKGTL